MIAGKFKVNYKDSKCWIQMEYFFSRSGFAMHFLFPWIDFELLKFSSMYLESVKYKMSKTNFVIYF